MVVYCCVKGCRNNSAEKTKLYGTHNSVTFHSFPSNSDVRSKWLKAIGRASWDPPGYARVCSIHFTMAQIKREYQRTRLIEDACPVNLLPQSYFDSSGMEVCRICLATDVRMFSLQAETLHNSFNAVIGLNKEIEGLPQGVCYECAAQLLKCHNLIQKSAIAKTTLLDIFAQNGEVSKHLVKLVNRDQLSLNSNLVFNTVVPKTIIDLQYDEDLQKYTYQSKTEENICHKEDGSRKFPKDVFKVEVNIDFENDLEGRYNNVTINSNFPDAKDTKNEDLNETDDYNIDTEINQESDEAVESKFEVDTEEIQEKKPRRKARRKVSSANKNSDGLTPDEVEMQQYFNIVTLTLEQQIEEHDRLKESPAYRDALYKCETCYKTYMHPNAFKVHVDNHDPSRGRVSCPVCKLRFKSDVMARSHANRTHAKRFYCKSCPKVFNYVRIAKIHQKRHEGFVYKCPFCDFSTLHESALGLHVRSQHPARHLCSHCGQGFASERGLALHARRTCSRQRPEQQSGSVHCKECDISFVSEELWRVHVLSPGHNKHETDGVLAVADPATSCPRCPLQFSSAALLQRHLLEGHARPHNWHAPGGRYPTTCEHCGESVKNRKEHYMHIRKMHPKERESYQPVITAVCDTCGKGFQNSTKLHLHELRHRGAGTVHCPHCPRLFYDKYQLARHVGVHSDARPYACTLCDKAFKLRSNLDRHAKVHSGVTPYECTMCGKRFRYSSSRNLHVRTVHYKMPHPPRRKRAPKRNPELAPVYP